MKLIEQGEVNAMLDFPTVIASLISAHERAAMEVAESIMGSPEATYFVRHAVERGRYMASKLITSFPANLATGTLPAIQAIVVLFDGRDGRPLEIIDGTSITHWRTAADSAIGSKFLARPDSTDLLIVGAGEMSKWLARAHASVLPALTQIRIWNRTSDRAEKIAAQLRTEGLPTKAVGGSLDEAVQTADVISSCTRSTTPIIKGSLLKPGTHLDLVGGYTPHTREADDDAAMRARIFVDLRQSAFHGVGDILQPIENGAITDASVLGELADLVTGRVVGRRSIEDITFYKNAGGGHLDLMLAALIHDLRVK
ncbi:hypothetical protein Gbfr_045_015 [Gluconobacter frateurii M-2]|nr:hypothetical protein Gbfr_045_015 [Gluconobacter frateurii M-2]